MGPYTSLFNFVCNTENIAVKARKPFMSVTGESAGLKVAGVCYAMAFIEASPDSDDDDSWSNSEPDS